jgi:hypothetical protein
MSKTYKLPEDDQQLRPKDVGILINKEKRKPLKNMMSNVVNEI